MTDLLVKRTAAIATQARADHEALQAGAEARRAERRRQMPETAKFMDDFMKHLGVPCWFRLTEGELTYEFGERPSWDGTAVQASPSFVHPKDRK